VTGTTEQHMSPKGLAAYLGVSVSWVYAQAEAGRLPGYKLGKYWRFKQSEIEEWLKQHKRGGGNGHAS